MNAHNNNSFITKDAEIWGLLNFEQFGIKLGLLIIIQCQSMSIDTKWVSFLLLGMYVQIYRKITSENISLKIDCLKNIEEFFFHDFRWRILKRILIIYHDQ